MIKDLGFRQVSLRSLRLPGDLRELAESSTVDGLGEALRDIGQAHPVIIRKSDHAIVAGRRRLAAAIKAGVKRVWVRWVECDELERLLLSKSENVHRTNRSPGEMNQLATELVELMSRRIRETDPLPKKPNGRPTSPRVVARAILAEMRGVTPETLRVQEHQERVRKGEPPLKRGRPRADELMVRPALELLGVEPDESWLARVVEVSSQLGAALKMVRQAKSYLSAIQGALPRQSAQRLAGEAEALEAKLQSLQPATVCPYCKALDHLVGNCGACSGSGWLGKGQRSGIPPELLDERHPKVVVGGDIVDATEEEETEEEEMDLFS